MNKPTLKFWEVENHPFRKNEITKEQAIKLADYLSKQDAGLSPKSDAYIAEGFEGKTYEAAANWLDKDLAEENLQHIICCLHDLEGEY